MFPRVIHCTLLFFFEESLFFSFRNPESASHHTGTAWHTLPRGSLPIEALSRGSQPNSSAPPFFSHPFFFRRNFLVKHSERSVCVSYVLFISKWYGALWMD